MKFDEKVIIMFECSDCGASTGDKCVEAHTEKECHQYNSQRYGVNKRAVLFHMSGSVFDNMYFDKRDYEKYTAHSYLRDRLFMDFHFSRIHDAFREPSRNPIIALKVLVNNAIH